MGWVNFWIPKVGLGGKPVGTVSARARGANAPMPFVITKRAAAAPQRFTFDTFRGLCTGAPSTRDESRDARFVAPGAAPVARRATFFQRRCAIFR
jgi:hypothetical protein